MRPVAWIPFLLLAGCSTLGWEHKDLADARREIDATYQFFTSWSQGSVPEDSFDTNFPPLASDFTIYAPPNPAPESGAAIRETLRGRYGEYAGRDYTVEIDELEIQQVGPATLLATFLEVATLDGNARRRASSAVLRVDGKRRHGLEWVHVHESWINP